MALDQNKFYPVVLKYYEERDYEGLCTFLDEQEKELKYEALPDHQCTT